MKLIAITKKYFKRCLSGFLSSVCMSAGEVICEKAFCKNFLAKNYVYSMLPMTGRKCLEMLIFLSSELWLQLVEKFNMNSSYL